MSTFFISHTPYHILLACGLACLQNKYEKKYLIIMSDFENSNKYRDVLESWEKNPFSEIIILKGNWAVNKYVGTLNVYIRFSISMFNVLNNKVILYNYFAKHVKDSSPKTYLFNDSNVQSQYLAKLTSDKKGKVYYVEDGSAAYNGHLSVTSNGIIKIIYKLFFGLWYHELEIFGTSKYVNEIIVSYPQAIRPELREKKSQKLPDQIYDFLSNFLSHFLITNFGYEVPEFDCVIVLPHSEILRFSNVNITSIFQNITSFLAMRYKVGIKYHPREINNYLNFENEPNISIIPKLFPLEVIWMHLRRNKIKVIIGDTSTSLISAKEIMTNNTKVISIAKLLDMDPKDYSYLCNFGIECVDSFIELKNNIDDI